MAKETYDLILSLGGNCGAASQLIFRDLRRFSLPFDYTFMADDKPVRWFPEGLKNRFKDLLLKENLSELKGKERGDDRETWQYKDTLSGYRFIHLFGDDVAKDGVYEKGAAVIRRRVDRLFEKLEKAEKILVILSTTFVFDEKPMYKIKETFETLYPSKKFVFYVVMLNAENETQKDDGDIHFIYAKRNGNLYDFDKTNWEWHFLDNVALNEKKRLFIIKKLKHGVCFCLFPFLPTVFRVKTYILGVRLDLCLGKLRQKF